MRDGEDANSLREAIPTELVLACEPSDPLIVRVQLTATYLTHHLEHATAERMSMCSQTHTHTQSCVGLAYITSAFLCT